MKIPKNGLKFTQKKSQNLPKNHQKAWAIDHENAQKLPTIHSEKNSLLPKINKKHGL